MRGKRRVLAILQTPRGSACGNRSSEQERRVDAMALIADEGRGKLRKASGSRKQALSRGYPNGETRRG